MSDKIIACTLDVAGVQTYIFSSNKLKENLGASSIVKNIYSDFLSCIIEEHFDIDGFDIDFWKSMPETKDNTSEDDQRISLFRKYAGIDICYIGGGNALLFFKTRNDFSAIIKKFTSSFLLHAPGLYINTAHIETDQAQIKDNFFTIKEELDSQLYYIKNTYVPNITLPRHGFTASCPRTGLSVEKLMIDKNGKVDVFSSVSATKINSADDNNAFDNEFKKNLEFTKDIEKLGQKEGDDNFIAVVHIDGNEIGALFKEAFNNNSFMPARRLSQNLATSTKAAFDDLIKIIIKDEKQCLISSNNKKFGTLPIRPIIIGGDDITFVCPGKLGIYFAEKFMEFFENQTARFHREPLSACAGVAIAKTKYPFFRAYKIAEELCSNAKQKRKKTEDKKGCWIDFHIVEAAKTGNLNEVREAYYQTQLGKLYMRPYPLKSNSSDTEFSLSSLKQKAFKLKKLPKNKKMELAQILFETKAEQEQFIEHCEYREYDLFLPAKSNKSFFLPTRKGYLETYFLDMIELLEFYPEKLLNIGENNENET